MGFLLPSCGRGDKGEGAGGGRRTEAAAVAVRPLPLLLKKKRVTCGGLTESRGSLLFGILVQYISDVRPEAGSAKLSNVNAKTSPRERGSDARYLSDKTDPAL